MGQEIPGSQTWQALRTTRVTRVAQLKWRSQRRWGKVQPFCLHSCLGCRFQPARWHQLLLACHGAAKWPSSSFRVLMQEAESRVQALSVSLTCRAGAKRCWGVVACGERGGGQLAGRPIGCSPPRQGQRSTGAHGPGNGGASCMPLQGVRKCISYHCHAMPCHTTPCQAMPCHAFRSLRHVHT